MLLGDEVVATLDLRSSFRQTLLQCVSANEMAEGDPTRPLTIEVISSGREVTIDGFTVDPLCE